MGIAYEEWTKDDLLRRFPLLDLHEFWPPKRPATRVPRRAGRRNQWRGVHPKAGYVIDPQLATHNLQRAAEASGGRLCSARSVTEIRQRAERVAECDADDGTQIDAPVVVNVAGPHSFLVNRLAGVEDQMHIKNPAITP